MGITDKIFEKMTDRKGLFQGGVEGEGFATQGRIFGRLRDKLEGKESAGYHNPDLEKYFQGLETQHSEKGEFQRDVFKDVDAFTKHMLTNESLDAEVGERFGINSDPFLRDFERREWKRDGKEIEDVYHDKIGTYLDDWVRAVKPSREIEDYMFQKYLPKAKNRASEMPYLEKGYKGYKASSGTN